MPLPNKQGEPQFKMKYEPTDRLVFKYKLSEECTVPLTLTNTTKDRMCFKVKCTDNELFRVRPPLGFIKTGETAVIKVTLRPRPGLDGFNHFFAIYHVACNEAKLSNPRAVWTADTAADGVVRLSVRFNPTDEEEKKDEKEEEKKEEKKEEKNEEKKE